MMQMLQGGGINVLTDGIRQADDDNPRGYFELEAVKRTKSDATWLVGAPGSAVKVIYKLLYDLPPEHHYQVVFMRRPIEEILASQAAMLERLGTQGASIPKDRLADLFNRQLADVIDHLTRRAEFSLLEIEFRDLIDAPLTAAESVSKFLGRPLDHQAMTAAVDTRLYRQQSD
jgi:hypothetical protein